jgi:hypothetical protein
LTLPVLEIYQRVDNQEMCDFLKMLDDTENITNSQTTSSS